MQSETFILYVDRWLCQRRPPHASHLDIALLSPVHDAKVVEADINSGGTQQNGMQSIVELHDPGPGVQETLN